MSASVRNRYWYITYKFPISLPTRPFSYDDSNFDKLFVRLKIYDELDDYLNNIERQHGTFWVSSPGGGYGKSTMLNYIARKLHLNLGDFRTLPIFVNIVKPYQTLEHAFFKGFLKGFLEVGSGFKIAKRTSPEIERIIIRDFERHKTYISSFLQKLPKLSLKDLEFYFNKVLRILNEWLRKGVLHKYVLLIDEMDKVSMESVLDFLGGNQGRFEELYDKYEFVTFIAGHKPWVDRIYETTEYSFYQGKRFNIPPIMSVEDVKKLILSRLMIFAYMKPADVPFTEEAYERILELTRGVPRKIIQLAQEAINNAYKKRAPYIGPGIVEETSIEEHRDVLVKYLQEHYELYRKLEKAVKNRLHRVLCVFYESPGHEILKRFDTDIDARTKILGFEISNNDWLRQMEQLQQLECIIDKEDKRVLSSDLVKFFDLLERECPIDKMRILEELIRSIGPSITPPRMELTDKDILNIIKEKVFGILANRWVTEEELLRLFSTRWEIEEFIKAKYKGRKVDEVAKELFTRYFNLYLKQAVDVLIYERDGRKLYRKLPRGITLEDYKKLRSSIEDFSVINDYIECIALKTEYDANDIKRIDGIIEALIIRLGSKLGVPIEGEFLRHRIKRSRTLKRLLIPDRIRKYIESYIQITTQEPFITEAIKPLAKSIISELSEQVAAAKSVEEYELLRKLELNLRKLIETKLSEITDKWWIERVPRDVRESAEQRRKREEALWPWVRPSKDLPLLMYVNFSEYAKIILRRDNWRDVFKEVFGEKTLIESRLKELEHIRNMVMHFRVPLAPKDKQKLRIYVGEITECIERALRRRTL